MPFIRSILTITLIMLIAPVSLYMTSTPKVATLAIAAEPCPCPFHATLAEAKNAFRQFSADSLDFFCEQDGTLLVIIGQSGDPFLFLGLAAGGSLDCPTHPNLDSCCEASYTLEIGTVIPPHTQAARILTLPTTEEQDGVCRRNIRAIARGQLHLDCPD